MKRMIPTCHTHCTERSASQAGFTLVELAIVLVIIGLIIGGVLVGQDMIKAAEVRATAGQFEKYNAAINIFKDKYRLIPGDLTPVAATQFGFLNTPARGGVAGQGDGNGLLEGCGAAAMAVGCETMMVWEDLSTARLVDGSFQTAAATTAPSLTAATMPDSLPVARMGRGNYITAYANAGRNFYQLGGITSTTTGAPTLAATLTPQEAFNIDSKLDDGRPNTGSTQARLGTGSAFNAAIVVAGTCSSTVTATVSGLYTTTTDALANTPACALRVSFN